MSFSYWWPFDPKSVPSCYSVPQQFDNEHDSALITPDSDTLMFGMYNTVTLKWHDSFIIRFACYGGLKPLT